MRFAYADPPYLGQAAKLYADPTYDDIEAHADLLDSLTEYDGWAYSLSSTTLRDLLPLAPEGVRVGAWVKPWCSFKKGQELAYGLGARPLDAGPQAQWWAVREGLCGRIGRHGQGAKGGEAGRVLLLAVPSARDAAGRRTG